MSHVVLLGDSVFDNAAYIPGQPDVVRQVRAKLPPGRRATLCAVDRATTRDVASQLRNIPPDATHLVVIAGGNDALWQSYVLRQAARSVADVLNRLADIRDRFAHDYDAMLDAVIRFRLPTTLCTIYDARFSDPQEQRLVVTGLAIFNDVITRAAFARRFPLIDLRLICSGPDDHANSIEPSAKGGEKITTIISEAVAKNRSQASPVFATGRDPHVQLGSAPA
jgi:hypothetical protein